MKPLRTALFAPGNRPDRVEKALNLNADAVIIDLEDAVPIAEKESTRGIVKQLLDGNPGKRIYVRVNALTTPYVKEDIAALGSVNLTGIMLPKVDSPEDLIVFDELLSHLEKESSLLPGSLEVISICETAKGLDQISKILSAKTEQKRDTVVAFGAADYTLDLGINLTREGKELDYARIRLPIASRAARIAPPIDTPWMVDLKGKSLSIQTRSNRATRFSPPPRKKLLTQIRSSKLLRPPRQQARRRFRLMANL